MVIYKPKTLPLIPLAKGTVLLPGIVQRIPLGSREDIPALLSKVYSRGTQNQRLQKPESNTIAIGCVPLASALLNNEGQRLIGGSTPANTPVDGERDALSDLVDVASRLAKEQGRDVEPGHAGKHDLFLYGTLARIVGVEGRGSGELAIVVEGISRFKIERFTQERPFFQAEVSHHNDDVVESSDVATHGLFQQLKTLSRELLMYLRLSALIPGRTSLPTTLARRLEMFIAKKDIQDAGLLADFMTNVVEATFEEKLQALAAWDVKNRLEKAIELLSRQVTNIKGTVKITSISTGTLPGTLDITQLNKRQREALARRGIGSGQVPPGGIFGGGGSAPGEDGEDENEVEELKRRLDEAKLSSEAEKVAARELKRLKKMNPAQAEYSVIRTYLENLAEIPWTTVTDDQLGPDTVARARKQLDDDHYGLEKIKKRLLEYLAVLKLKQQVNADIDVQVSKVADEAAQAADRESKEKKDESIKQVPRESDKRIALLKRKRMVDKSPILLLVGPPGTGKTSLAKSVATALGRKFHRISLGGVRDEAEIRGHRRTYVAAMPGLIVSGLKKVGVANPVFLLDEIDKVSTSNFHGDPSAALLEVLDPEQNHTFVDHYVNIPLDLSKVLFIATANTTDTIPAPLLDRMEMITLSGYTSLEKRSIARQYLIPKQLTTNGLGEGQVQMPDEVILKLITNYTRESGVRNLEREIGSICRYKAVEFSEAKDSSNLEKYRAQITVEDLEEILGIEKFDEEIAERTSRPGVVTGLVAYSIGGNGSILFIEVADMPGNGRVQLTGKLGEVLKESVEVALTWVRAHSYELGLTHDPTEDIMKNRNVHVHCPAGAIPKDGPSAGLAHTIALISLFSGKAVPPTLAMTGEVSLRGRVTAVGGIKEKLIGALRAGCKTVLLPAQNRKDIKDLPREVTSGLDIIFVKHIWEAMKHVWPEAHWPGEQHLAGIESRL